MTLTPAETNQDLANELSSDYRRYQHLRRTYAKKVNNFQSHVSLETCNATINVAEELFDVSYLMLTKVISALRQFKAIAAQLQKKIEAVSKPKSRSKRKKRHVKPPDIFINDSVFSAENGKRSFYFKTDSNYHRHRTADFCEIFASGHKFISCLHEPYRWTKSDVGRLYNGVRQCLINEKHDQLRATQQKIKELIILDVGGDDDRLNALQEQSNFLHKFLTESADAKLSTLLKSENVHREFRWDIIAKTKFKGRRLPEECQRTWHLIAKPSLRNVPWTLEDDILLRSAVIENRYQAWDRVYEQMSRYRSEFLYFVRYQTVWKNHRSSVMKKWTHQENRILQDAIETPLSDYVWKVKDSFPDLSEKQILQHLKYLNSICNKNRGFFTKRERYFINSYVKRGYSYQAISRILGSRSPQQIRNYVQYSMKGTSGRWTSKETADLLRAVRYIGVGRWTKVSEYVPSRTPVQCRLRFFRIRNSDFSRKESAKQRVRNVRRFLSLPKKRRSESVNKDIELYFMQLLQKKMPAVSKKCSLVEHVFSLLNFLNFNLDCPTEYAQQINDWLVNFSSSEENSTQSFDHLFTGAFGQSCSNIRLLKRNPLFCNVVSKSTAVLPPNKCSINGYHTFTKNHDKFAKEHNGINFEMYWKQINSVSNKRFLHAKIMWYRVLRALFFWPMKLSLVFPEHLLKK